MIGTLATDGWAVNLVQQGGASAGCSPAHSPRCTKCNSPPINGQCTNFILFDMPLHWKGLKHIAFIYITNLQFLENRGHWKGLKHIASIYITNLQFLENRGNFNGYNNCSLLGRFLLPASKRRHKLAAFCQLLLSITGRRVANGNRYCMLSHLVSIHLQHGLCRKRLHIHKYRTTTVNWPFIQDNPGEPGPELSATLTQYHPQCPHIHHKHSNLPSQASQSTSRL